MLLCRVALGRSFIQFNAMKVAHAPPGHHSVVGRPSAGGLNFAEYVIYRGEQAYPEYRITYLLVPPTPSSSSSASPVDTAGNGGTSGGAGGGNAPSTSLGGGGGGNPRSAPGGPASNNALG